MQMNISLAISTYQAQKVVFISAKNPEQLVQLPRTLPKAMGIAVDGERMAIAGKDEVLVLRRSSGLADAYPKQPNTYDQLYVPRATYYTGQVDIHDLAWGNDGLWGVNTSFSCLAKINDEWSFEPQWQPPFITKLASEDRCHLNGLVLKDGRPKWVTALGTTDTPQGWRDNITGGGVLMDVDTNENVLEGLPMPHSPRLVKDRLFLLLSASAQLVEVDVNNGTYNEVRDMKAFVRGMAAHGDYLFVAHSRLRKNSSTFRHLPVAKLADQAGIKVIHIPTGALVGEIKWVTSVDEIYDVQVLPATSRPGIITPAIQEHKLSLQIPGASFWGQSREAQANPTAGRPQQ